MAAVRDLEAGAALEKGSPKDESDEGTNGVAAATTGFTAQGMGVTFKDVVYTVINSQNKKEKINLLHGVSGYLRAGELVALMGPSGSGKTTLLDVLAGRKTVGTIEGEIKFGGEVPSKQFLRRFTGYVEQHDTLIPILTVHEMFMYTAEMCRSRKESLESKKAAVEEVIEVLALTGCRNVKIGSALSKGISGGQAKRVNIGIALVSTPRVLFLDEPTSGLDSYTSNEVMAAIQRLARSGLTVCATIHSPTPFAFALFDRLMLLLSGQVVYFGRNGEQAIDFFRNSCPDVPGLLEQQNPAEWIVDLTTQADRRGKAPEFAAAYDRSELKAHADKEIAAQLAQSSSLGEEARKELAVKRATTTPTLWALWTMFRYRTSKNYRDGEFLGPRIADKFLFAFVIFTLYWKKGDNLDNSNVINIAAVLFMTICLPAYAAVAYTPAIVLERPLYTRERNDGYYRSITYLMFKIFEELGIATIVSLVYANLVFWLVKLQGSFALYWLVYYVTLITGITFAYAVAALSPNMDIANAALPTFTTTFLFFTGFLIPASQIPRYWIWYSYIDYLKYAWGALMKNQFNGDRDVPYLGGDTILGYYDLAGINAWGWWGIEIVFFFFFAAMAFLALTFVNHVRR